jgi:transcriptional regulator with XRE-family HTH domain
MSDPLVQFGRNLRRLREERGLSQDALAQRAGMDAAEIRRIEWARRDPGVRVVARLARALDVKVSDLTAGF